jgi:hypothetical protein
MVWIDNGVFPCCNSGNPKYKQFLFLFFFFLFFGNVKEGNNFSVGRRIILKRISIKLRGVIWAGLIYEIRGFEGGEYDVDVVVRQTYKEVTFYKIFFSLMLLSLSQIQKFS